MGDGFVTLISMHPNVATTEKETKTPGVSGIDGKGGLATGSSFGPAHISNISCIFDWQPATTIGGARSGFGFAQFADGRTLIVGGNFDPFVSTLSPGVISNTGASYTATGASTDPYGAGVNFVPCLLGDGRILNSGWFSALAPGNISPTVETIDPVTLDWTAQSAMVTKTYLHELIKLTDGNALKIGGRTTLSLSSAVVERFNYASNTWTSRTPMGTARTAHSADLLNDGRVLVAGGLDSSGNPLSTCEIYDPSLNSWTPTGSMSTARAYHAHVKLNSGKILVVGEHTGSGSVFGEIYDPDTGLWANTGNLPYPQSPVITCMTRGMFVLQDECAYLVGGYSSGAATARVAVYDPTNNTWSAGVSMSVARSNHGVTYLGGCKILAFGGTDASSNTLNSSETSV